MPRTKRNAGSVRLNLEISPAVRERLERLRTGTDAESLTEVIRRSLAVYEALIDIADGETSLVMLDKRGREQRLVLVP